MCLRTGLQGSTKKHQTILHLIAYIITFSIMSAKDNCFTLLVLQQQPLLPHEWQIWKLFLNGGFYTFSCQAWVSHLPRKCLMYLFKSVSMISANGMCLLVVNCPSGRQAQQCWRHRVHSNVRWIGNTTLWKQFRLTAPGWNLVGEPPHSGPLSFLIRLCCQARINTYFSFSSGWLVLRLAPLMQNVQ